MLISFVSGLFIGAIQIGAQTSRTLAVYDGKILYTLVMNVILSVGYFISIAFIINQDIPGYVGFSIGAGTVTCFMAWKNKHKRPTNETRTRTKDT